MTNASWYRYIPLLRPATFGALPSGVKWDYAERPTSFPMNRPDLPLSTHRFGVIVIDQKLPDDRARYFDLRYDGEAM
jgi:hypothetical protein